MKAITSQPASRGKPASRQAWKPPSSGRDGLTGLQLAEWYVTTSFHGLFAVLQLLAAATAPEEASTARAAVR